MERASGALYGILLRVLVALGSSQDCRALAYQGSRSNVERRLLIQMEAIGRRSVAMAAMAQPAIQNARSGNSPKFSLVFYQFLFVRLAQLKVLCPRLELGLGAACHQACVDSTIIILRILKVYRGHWGLRLGTLLHNWFCCSEALRISFPYLLNGLALPFQAMALQKVQLQRGHQPRRPLRTSCLPVVCLFPGASTFPGAQRPQSAEWSRSGSRLLWLPCLALLGRVTHRRGVPCFDRKPFRGRKMQGGGKGKGKGKGGNPAVLTSKIKEAETAAEVLRLLDGAVDGPIFNDFHASAACTRLAAFHKNGEMYAVDAKSPVIQRLANRIEILIKADEVGRRGLANVLWAFAKMFVAVPAVLLTMPALVRGVAAKAKGMNARDLANSLWAAAQLQDPCPEVVEMVPAIVAQCPGNAGDMNAQDLSNIILAAAKLQDVAPVVLEALPAIAAEISGKAGDMKPQELSNSVWGTAKLQDAIPDSLDIVPALVKEFPVKVGNMIPQELSNSLWAAA